MRAKRCTLLLRAPRLLALVCLLVLLPLEVAPVQLGSPCTPSLPCSTPHSRCRGGLCECQPFYISYNDTQCLQSTLLGDSCVLPEQCSMKVAHSTCIAGSCDCENGYLRFRRHTCLGPAKVGDVCYSNDHCILNSNQTYCEFTIANLFGTCRCKQEGIDEDDPECGQTTEESIDYDQLIATTTLASPPSISTTLSSSTSQSTTNATETTTELEDLLAIDKAESDSSKVTTEILPTTLQSTKDTASKLNEEMVYQSVVHLLQQNNKNVKDSADSPEAKYREELEDVLFFAPSSSFVNRGAPIFLPLTDNRPLSLLSKLIGKQAATLKPIEENEAISLGLPCERTEQCRKADLNSVCSDGVCDCMIKGNSSDSCSSKNNSCFPGTFQCRRSGVCLSWFFVCDGRRDCPDGSDEECAGPNCPPLSYQCGNKGMCVSRSVVCDGKKNCPDGEDESDCSVDVRNASSCPEHSYRCSNGQCVPEYEFCNAIPACDDGTDEPEALCRSHRPPSRVLEEEYCPFRCDNGRCRSTAIVCSGRDGCGDNSDENKCSVCRCPAR